MNNYYHNIEDVNNPRQKKTFPEDEYNRYKTNPTEFNEDERIDLHNSIYSRLTYLKEGVDCLPKYSQEEWEDILENIRYGESILVEKPSVY